MSQISAAMLPHGVHQFVIDHVPHLSASGFLIVAAKFAAKRLLIAAAKRLIVRFVPAHLLARFVPSWLPAKPEAPALLATAP